MPGKNYYQILGVSRNATEKDIKQAYRRLARRYHPDVNPGDKSAEEKFKGINEAYEVLSNAETRQKYDEFGDQWQYADQIRQAQAGGAPFGGVGSYGEAGGFRFEQGDLGSIFEDLFAGPFGGKRGTRPRRGQDIDYPVEVTLEEAYRGTTRVLSLESEVNCSICRGSGRVQNAVCSACRGRGTVPMMRRLEVKIPAGVGGGSRVRLAGQGGSGAHGGEAGDLYLVVSVKSHPVFERKGEDLYTDVSVSLTTAVLGGEVELDALKGKVALKIPPETQNGRVFRLSGQGMPRLGDSVYGDLYARASVELPTNLTPGERHLFEELKKLRYGG